MSGIQQVAFTSPYAGDQEAIQRQKLLAEMLQKQAMSPIDQPGTPAGGFTPRVSPFQGLAKVAQGYAAGMKSEDAEAKQKALSEKYQTDYRDMVAKGLRQLQGTPAQPGGEFEDSMGIGRTNPGQPAVAPDPMSALATFGSHPQGQPFMALPMQEMQRQQMIQALRGGAPGAPAPQGGAMPPQQPGAMPAGPQAAPAPGGMPAPPGVPPQAMGGPAGGQPLEIWLRTDPSGKSYVEQLAKDYASNTKPMAVPEGGSVWVPGKGFVAMRPKLGEGVLPQMDPQGNVTGVVPMPGAAAAAAGQAGAVEGAKAGYDMITVNTPQGPKMMTRAQAAQMAGGGQGGPQPVTPPPVPVQGTAPDLNAAMQQFPAGDRTPRTVQYGQGAGIPLQGSAATRAEGEIGAGLGKRYNDIQDAGFGANQKINKISRLGNLLEGTTTGKLSPAGYEVASYMHSMGIPVSKTLANAQAAKAAAQEFALELRNPSGGAGMPGAMSDADRIYLNGLVANIDKDKATNKEITQAMTKIAERERDIAKLAREYKRKNGSFDDGFYDELDKFSKENHLFGGQGGATDDPLNLRKKP